jgi:histidine triad (HIT) family protein
MTTIFSKIIAREIPAEIVYEDDRVIAILDINPVHPGHTLVIPKTFSASGLECAPEDFAYLMNIGQNIAQALIEALLCDGINFIMNNGVAAGQEVFHTHLHVVPRYTDDHSFSKPTHVMYDEHGPMAIGERLRKALPK